MRGIYKSPSAYFVYNDKIIKVLQTQVIDEKSGKKAGEIIRHSKSGVDINTSDGVLRLVKIKPEGKGEMFASDWANGLRI